MKPFFLSALLSLLLGLGLAGRSAAQCTINTPPCATPFVAIDVATGQQVQALCVGRAVRFELSCGRTVAASLLYYNALSGSNSTPAGCDFTPGRLANNTYTPTAAGTIAISELANPAPGSGGGVGTVYVRNFQVYGTPPPQITVQACARNMASLLITTSGYDSYFAQINKGPQIGPLVPGTVSLPAAAGSTITVTGHYNSNTLCTGQTSAVVPTLVVQQPRIPTLTVQGPLIGPIDFTFSGLRQNNTSVLLANLLQVADPSTPTRFRSVVGFEAPTSDSQIGPQGLYRLANYDVCGLDSTFSEPVPAINLTATSANNVNTISWLAFGPVASYTLLRNGNPLVTLPAGTSRYNDVGVACGTRYTYRLQATTAGGSRALSNEVTVQAVSTLAPPPPLLNASFDLQNRLTLTASQTSGGALAPGGQLRYSRQGGPGALDFAAVPTATDTLRDPAPLTALLAAPPCYTVRLQDAAMRRLPARPPVPACSPWRPPTPKASLPA
jgi:hypothetical protein